VFCFCVANATVFDRVLAPEGEIVSFAPLKESIQRKGGSITAQSALLGFVAANENKTTSLPNISD